MIRMAIENVKRARLYFEKQDPNFDMKPAPVLGCPPWFLEEVRESYGAEPDQLVDFINGVQVLERPDFSEPLFILHDGRFCAIMPAWARAQAAKAQAEHLAASADKKVDMPDDVILAAPAEAAVAKIARDAA